MIANPPPYDGDGQTTLRGTPNALAVPTSRNAPCRHLIPRLRRRVGCLHLQPIPCREHNPLTLRAIRPTHRNEHQSTNQLINSHGRPRAPFNLGNSADFRFSAKWKISLSRHGPSFPAAPHTPPPIISLITERTETATPAGWGIQTSTRIIRLIWRTSQAAIIPTHMGRGGSIGSFRYPLTRRNHGMPNNPYPLPNDELEKERLNALQRCFYMFFGTNIHAPIIKKPTQIGMTSIIDDPH